MDYDELRENAMGWQKRAYRAEVKLAEVRATAEYWRSDAPRLPQVLRQGAATLLALLDQKEAPLGGVVGPLDEYRGQ